MTVMPVLGQGPVLYRDCGLRWTDLPLSRAGRVGITMARPASAAQPMNSSFGQAPAHIALGGEAVSLSLSAR